MSSDLKGYSSNLSYIRGYVFLVILLFVWILIPSPVIAQEVIPNTGNNWTTQAEIDGVYGCGYVSRSPLRASICINLARSHSSGLGLIDGENFDACSQPILANDNSPFEPCCITEPQTVFGQPTASCREFLTVIRKTGQFITPENSPISFDLCAQTGDKQGACEACKAQGSVDSPTVWTAIGCINTSSDGIVGALVRLALGVSGGVVLFKILGASLKLTISKGEPKEVEEAREEITNAVIGLLFIVFSMVILEFIGISILQIPGF